MFEIDPEKHTSISERAAQLCLQGYYPLPIQLGSKAPTLVGWDKLRLTADQCDSYFADAGLIGCLHSNLAGIDIDVTDPLLSEVLVNEGLRRWPTALERVGQWPKTCLVLRLEEPGFKVSNTEKQKKVSADGEVFSAHVEFRSVTGQMVVYGPHPATGKPYTWTRGELWQTPRKSLPEATKAEVQDYRDWCNKQIREWGGAAAPTAPTARIFDLGDYKPQALGDDRASEPEFLEALSYVPASMGYGGGWLEALMAIHDFYHGSQRGLEQAREWSSVDARYNPAEVDAKWRSFETGKGVSYRAIFHHAQQAGADLAAISRKHRRKPAARAAAEAPRAAAPATASAGAEGTEWHAGLVINNRGRIIFNTHNVMTFLMHDPELVGCFTFDDFSRTRILARPLPGDKTRKDLFQSRPIRDSDITQVVAYFNKSAFPDAAKGIVYDAIDAVAEFNSFHPVRTYLAGLPAWDGVPRISKWLTQYCRADGSDPGVNTYIAEIGRRWLISAIARVMRPGCKADGVLILEGRQGARKSTALRILASDEWFGDSLPPMASKDASSYVCGKWIIELAELSNLNKADVEISKAFISRDEERFRPAYGRNEIRYPRQCVFAGTTNKADYLRDETGNRRFWPVKVGVECDTDALQRDRDQIWAEALAAYKSGEPWWLVGSIADTAAVEQGARVSQDAWEGDIVQYLGGMSEVSAAEIARSALSIEVGRTDRVIISRIVAVLTQNGFASSGRFTSGINKGRTRFVRRPE